MNGTNELKEHTEIKLIIFYSHRGLCKSEEIKYICTNSTDRAKW